jgi:hypothetical protein
LTVAKWPAWVKALLAAAGLALLIVFAQLLLYLDKMGAGKFDL